MATRSRDRMSFKRQSAIQTPVVADMIPLPVTSRLEESYTEDTKASGRQNANNGANLSRQGKNSWGYTLTMELDATDSLGPIQELLGDNTDDTDSPVAGANEHILTATSDSTELLQMYTKGFTIAADGNDDSKGVELSGCIVTKMSIAEIENGNYPVTFDILARNRDEDPTVTISGSVSPEPQVFCNLQAVFKAGEDGSEVTTDHVVGSLEIERTDIAPHFRGDDNLLKRYVQGEGGMLNVTGTFEIEMSDTEYAAIYDDFVNNTTMSVQVIFTTDIFITGTTPYSLAFDMPECKYTMLEPRTDGHLRLMKFTFTAGQGTGSALVTVTAINGAATIAS